MGRMVAYQPVDGVFVPAVVVDVREDGWTVSLRCQDFHQRFVEFVPYGGGGEFGEIPVGTWVTLDEYEGWKIYADVRSAKGGGT